MRHTPGPWVWSEEHDGLYIRASAPFPDWYVCRLSENNGATVANSLLIAAAPDLLEAAQHVATVLDALEFNRVPARVVLPELWAVIARATGEA